MKYSKILICLVFTLLVGCTSQSSHPSFGDDFDQQKAAKTRLSLGLTYLTNGNYSQAKFNLDKALEFAPRSADVHYGMAYYYQTVGENAAAEASYQRAMDIDSGNADIANSYGAFLCQQGNYPKAKQYFLKAINSSNYISTAETYENLALCSQSQGYDAEATEFLRNALNHQPGRGKSLFLLTQSLIKEQRWGEAKDALKRYEKVAPISADTLLLASQIEQGLGNQAVADSYGAMLLKIYPDSGAANTYKNRALEAAQQKQPVARKSIKTEAPVSQPAEAAATPLEPMAQPQIEAQSAVLPANETSSTDSQQPSTEPDENSAVTIEEPQIADATVDSSSPSADTSAATDPVVTDAELPQAVSNTAPQPADSDEIDKKSQDKASFHVVKAGENLYRISLQYNIKMQRLIEWNQLDNASDIFAGKKLRLVAPETASPRE